MNRFVLPACLAAVAASLAAGAALWFASPSRSGSAPANPPPESASANQPRKKDAGPGLPPGFKVHFVEVTDQAGIDFTHFDGRTEMDYIMETVGSGLGWIDYDQDGLLDLFLVQGSTCVPPHLSSPPTSKLFKNLGGGRFRDVTEQVGLGHRGYGQGVAVGDFDNDGFPDLFLTCYGKPNVLYHNVSDGKSGRRFVDITARAGLGDHPDWRTRPNFSSSAAFLDYNNDGKLDLFVCSYVVVDVANYPECLTSTRLRTMCPPSNFEATHSVLYRNNGDGTFTDVSAEAGIKQATAKALGVIALDLDDDGLLDIFVASDSVPNLLYRNLGGGRFESVGLVSGCAVNGAGLAQGSMGVDADDLDGDGRPDLFVTAFVRDTNTYFRNEGSGRFLDITTNTGLGAPSWYMVAWGTFFFDVDRDGSLDLAIANGHVARTIDVTEPAEVTYLQPAQFFLNDGRGRFRDLSRWAGDYFRQPRAGRGLAAADYDNDGHMDLAFSNRGEKPALLHNESQTPYHWLRLELRGTRSNRDAIGAKVTFHLPDGRKLVRYRKGGGSYLAAVDPRLLVGVGPSQQVDRVEVRWPSGLVQQVGPLTVDRSYRLVEGEPQAVPVTYPTTSSAVGGPVP